MLKKQLHTAEEAPTVNVEEAVASAVEEAPTVNVEEAVAISRRGSNCKC